MAKPLEAFRHSPGLGSSRAYMGSILAVAVSGESTAGRLAIVEIEARPGNEPPPHVHEWEDELFYILEGRAEFYCGRDRLVAGAGDYVFLPHGVPHTMIFLTPEMRMMMLFSSADERPVGMDRYFLAMSEPARSLDLPPPGAAMTYAKAPDLARAAGLAAQHGCRLLEPEETREFLPDYPGFGVPDARPDAAASLSRSARGVSDPSPPPA